MKTLPQISYDTLYQLMEQEKQKLTNGQYQQVRYKRIYKKPRLIKALIQKGGLSFKQAGLIYLLGGGNPVSDIEIKTALDIKSVSSIIYLTNLKLFNFGYKITGITSPRKRRYHQLVQTKKNN